MNGDDNPNENVPTTSRNVGAEETKASKRAFLEINEIDKFKSLLVKPFETKKFKPSEALDRVRQFLPNFKESTDRLLHDHRENPNEANIENVEDEDEHIEMNLALIPESGSDSESEEDDTDEHSEQESSDTEKEDEAENTEDSSPNSVDDLQLGFKVKDATKLKRLKLPQSNSKSSKVKNMIQEIESSEKNTESTTEADVDVKIAVSNNGHNNDSEEV